MDYRPLPGLQCASLMLLFWGLICFGTAPPSPQRDLAEDLKGKPVDPFASSAGRVVVLFFVRTDCPISNRYAPTIQKLNEQFRGKANFWLVYPDADETAGRIRTHDEQFHLSIAALRDVHHDLVK